MGLLSSIRAYANEIKNNYNGHSFANLVWLINIVPSFWGFSLHKDKISAPFWILTWSLLIYVYLVGSIFYVLYIAETETDIIKNFVNISLFILIGNINFWWMTKRPILRQALVLLEENDKLARQSAFIDKYKRRISIIRKIVTAFYLCNMMNAACIYLPNRVDVTNNYSMAPCVGLEPLTSSPNKEICLILLCLQEFTIMSAVLNYQTLLLCLIAHTATMYLLLADEILALNQPKDVNIKAREKLPSIIHRHIIILHVFNKLKALYSLPIGIDFGTNAFCIAIFFYLTLEELVVFSPIIIYCILAFFLYCFLCQQLTDASEEFERAVYACGWDSFDLREKKMVYIILLQAQKPIVLLAADIIPVNIYTFATTLQGMFKVVTVVKF